MKDGCMNFHMVLFLSKDTTQSKNHTSEAWMTPQLWDKIQYVSSIEKICEDRKNQRNRGELTVGFAGTLAVCSKHSPIFSCCKSLVDLFLVA